MIDIPQLRSLVIAPVLREIGLYSLSAENLLVGTYLAESVIYGVTHLAQLNGPALGIYQMEPASYDTVVRYATRKRAQFPQAASYLEAAPPARILWDLRLATLAARMHYRRDRLPLPPPDDVPGLAAYWKRVWNTKGGKGDPAQFAARYKQHARAV